MEDFPCLSAEERRVVMGNVKEVDRFCQGVYIGPGSSYSLAECVRVKH